MTNPESSQPLEGDEIELGFWELNTLHQILKNYNELAEYRNIATANLIWQEGYILDVKIPQPGEAIRLLVGEMERDIGYFDPVMDGYVLYPELTDLVSPDEIQTLQVRALYKRQKAIEEFNLKSMSTPRVEYSHPKIKDLHKAHNNALIGTGVANLLDNIANHHNMNVSGITPVDYFDADEASRAAVFLKAQPLGYGGEAPDYILGLRLLGAYKNDGGMKIRQSIRYIELARRADIRDEQSPFIPKEMDGDPLIEEEELQELIDLIDDVKKIREEIPDFSSRTLGIELSPGKEAPLYF